MHAAWDQDDDLVVERKGKTYTISEPGHTRGLKIAAIVNGEADEVPGVEGWKLLLSDDAVDAMIADDCPNRFINCVYLAAVAMFIQGKPDRAKQIIESGLDPELLAAQEAANQETTEPTPSTRTDEVAKTRSRASGSGTRTSRRTSPAKNRSNSTS